MSSGGLAAAIILGLTSVVEVSPSTYKKCRRAERTIQLAEVDM
jgi:hypothetical protein